MFRPTLYLFSLVCAGLHVSADRSVAQQNTAEAKLRENLRNTTLQLRTVQAERDALHAAKAESDQKIATLTGQVEAMSKQLVADKDAADKAIAELKTKLEERDAEVTHLNESLAKWKVAHDKAVALANTKEAERAKFAMLAIELQRRVADQQAKNAAMYKIGNEILTRYEKFGLGTALAAREPFVGTMRVKLENLVQDYGDKLAEQRIKPGEATHAEGVAVRPSASTQSAAAGKPAAATPAAR